MRDLSPICMSMLKQKDQNDAEDPDEMTKTNAAFYQFMHC